jgi:catechol 2,3-dioxygenase-like lactoylglutathione lyase family enzyme
MAIVTQRGYLGLSVSDVDAWERFATQILGLQVNGREADGTLFLRMDEYHHRFIVHPSGKDDLAYVGWEVADEQTLQAMTDRLRDAGVAVQQGTPAQAEARRVVALIAFEDPNRLPSEAFYGPLMRFDHPFKSPRAISGFETGVMGWAISSWPWTTSTRACISTAPSWGCGSATSFTASRRRGRGAPWHFPIVTPATTRWRSMRREPPNGTAAGVKRCCRRSSGATMRGGVCAAA